MTSVLGFIQQTLRGFNQAFRRESSPFAGAALSAVVHEQEERDLRLARLHQEIQIGLDSGPSRAIDDIDGFLEACAEEAFGERKSGLS